MSARKEPEAAWLFDVIREQGLTVASPAAQPNGLSAVLARRRDLFAGHAAERAARRSRDDSKGCSHDRASRSVAPDSPQAGRHQPTSRGDRTAGRGAQLATLEQRLAVVEELHQELAALGSGQDLAGLKRTMQLVTATARELLPDAVIAARIHAADALRIRAAARIALLPVTPALAGSRIWIARVEVGSAQKALPLARGPLAEWRRLTRLKQERVAGGMARSGAELVALRGEIEFGAAAIAQAETAATAADAAMVGAVERERALVRRVGELRRMTLETDDAAEAEQAAAAYWDITHVATV